jgi:hypothetical protein
MRAQAHHAREGPMRATSLLRRAVPLLLTLPVSVSAQTGVTVEGRVYDAVSGAGVQNAIVELEGHGSTLTSEVGTFRFDRVQPGGYALSVDGFGYARESRLLSVARDTTLTIPLQLAPLALDSLLVEARLVDVEGRVLDATRDMYMVDAEILTNQVEPTWTGAHGTFDLEDVLADVPLRVVVQAFGYLPLDTVVLPGEDESYLFEVEPDPVVERMVEVQVRRLEDRASPRRSVTMRPMNRERLLRYAGRHTVASMLEWEYGNRLRRVRCLVLNEEQMLGGWEPSSLFHTLPEDLQRVELLFDGAMLRIYTREFMREMISREVELRTPSYFQPFQRSSADPLCT